jgi:hypothetical protein
MHRALLFDDIFFDFFSLRVGCNCNLFVSVFFRQLLVFHTLQGPDQILIDNTSKQKTPHNPNSATTAKQPDIPAHLTLQRCRTSL